MKIGTIIMLIVILIIFCCAGYLLVSGVRDKGKDKSSTDETAKK